jgi:hypothetical protein
VNLRCEPTYQLSGEHNYCQAVLSQKADRHKSCAKQQADQQDFTVGAPVDVVE